MLTPLVPPGLGVSHAHPTPIGERRSTPGPQVGTSTPSKSPAAPFSPAIPRPVTPLVPKSATKAKASGAKDESSPATTDAKKNIIELAAKSGLSKDIASQSSKTPKGKRVLQEEDFPALDSSKASSTPKITPAVPMKPSQPAKTHKEKKAAGKTVNKSSPEKNATKTEKRPVPGTLDIEAATKTLPQRNVPEVTNKADKPSDQGGSNTTQPTKSQAPSTVPTPTPTTASVSSPIARAAPKTLRLVQTPRAETPLTTLPSSISASIRSAGVAPSTHRPATPVSEVISDSASIVSASISASRTSSPPPSSKVGSASVRATTKSQQRKQRKEATKEAAAHLAETKPVEQEVEIAPIVSKKKKQKKDKKPSNVASAAPSRPETPSGPGKDISASQTGGSKQIGESSSEAKDSNVPFTGNGNSVKAKEDKGREVPSAPRSPTQIDTSIRLNESTKTTVLTPDYVSHNPEAKQEQHVDEDLGDIPNITDVLRTLIEEGTLPDADKLRFFKSPPSYTQRMDHSSTVSLPPTLKTIINKEDEEQLNAFKPVRKTVHGQPVLLTPNGDCLLNLSQEEEDTFLELQDRLRADSARPTAFSAPRYSPANGFSLVKNRAVPNGTPSFFPAGPDNYPSDPVGKMHREEAIGCINQHVLPSLNLTSCNNKTVGGNNSSNNPTNGVANSANFAKNVNLQQLAPWIYPSHEAAAAASMPIDSAYGSYDSAADGPAAGPSPAIGSTPLMSVEESETVLAQAKKQHEAIDKKFRQLQAKNRRLLDIH